MEEHKDPFSEPEKTEDEYAFLQEVIKDEAGGRVVRKDILRMIGLGFLLGLVACFSFVALKPWVEERFEKEPEKVMIPAEETTSPPEETVEVETPPEPPPQPQETVQTMLQKLVGTTRTIRNSMVVINIDESEKGNCSGIFVADNGKELLILGQPVDNKNAKSVRFVFPDGEAYEGVVKRQDLNTGLCIYAVARDTIKEESLNLAKIATLGSSIFCKSDEPVILVGQPFGHDQAAAYGLIKDAELEEVKADGSYQIIGTDIMGSGKGSGAIANENGEVIGILTPYAGENEDGEIRGYGITGIKKIIELLSNGNGVPYTGIIGTDVTEDMKSQGFPGGVLIREIVTDSPAMGAGIQVGDIILTVDDVEVTNKEEYREILLQKGEGSHLSIHANRQGTGGEYVEIEFDITVGTKEE